MPFLFFIRFTIFETDNYSELRRMKNYLKKREEYRKMGNGYYHLSTDGWKEGNIFNSVAQFAYGMILIGLISIRYSLVIYDFTLMPNHIHIVLSGRGTDAVDAFLYLRKKLNARLVADRCKPLPEDYGFNLKPIMNEEQMMDNIMYLDRNHYEKQFAALGGYPWGSGYLNYSILGLMIDGKRADEFSERELVRMTGSRDTTIPGHWKFHPTLGLLPSSFVDTRLVKRLFKGPKDYNTRIVKDYEAFVSIAQSIEEEIVFDEQEIRDIISIVLKRDFNGKRLSLLDNDSRGKLAVTLSTQYDIPAEAIAHELKMTVHIVNQFLRSKDYGKKHGR